jgi:DNA (cytosine-5)-methyltransferase 1
MNIKSVIPRMLKVNVPEVATKVLKLRTANDKKIMTLSSNWLPLFGFHGDARVVEEMIAPGKGYQIRLANEDDAKTKKVYLREYTSRSANPLKKDAKRVEQLVETAGQKIISEAMGHAEHVHITFRHGVLTFTPVTNAERKLLQDLSQDDMINTLVAMTGGVDCSVLEQGGFRVDTVVEFRPQEKRDKTDYTETTALSALANCAPRVLCNEDIYTLDMNKLVSLIGDTPITVVHASLQCDDFVGDGLKTKKDKNKSLDNLDSTIDMFLPTLNMLDAVKAPVLVVENVPGFMGSKTQSNPINDVLCLQLRRRGYSIHQAVFNSNEFGGYTGRKRMYLVATALNVPFSFPEPTGSRPNRVWDEIIVPHMDEIMQRDITDGKVTQDALASGRTAIIHKDRAFSPTILKAQGQSTKDSIMVEIDGRYYRPSLTVLEKLNSLPESFDSNWLPVDKAEQIIGQSICGKLHHAIMGSVKKHILLARDNIAPHNHQLSFAL